LDKLTSYFELITVNVGYYARIEGSQSAKVKQSSKFISYKLYIMIWHKTWTNGLGLMPACEVQYDGF